MILGISIWAGLVRTITVMSLGSSLSRGQFGRISGKQTDWLCRSRWAYDDELRADGSCCEYFARPLIKSCGSLGV